ncbi:MAG: hypothetical protein H6831_03660 [Planctomycetes bacterium]|nr:hypothetical protein [Planctomycetota bacterium]MCB9903482.1 hypothetical protein [Planctomycetota bacterium]
MRSARFTAPILALLLLFALIVREGPRPEGGAPPRPGVERFVEAEGAWNLRRVQLALASGRVAQFDRAARFPSGGDVVDPPVFVAALTGGAWLWLDGATGSASGAPLDEARLADVLRHVGPLLGLLLVLVAHRAVARLGGPSAKVRALSAAAQLAIGAPFVLALEAGRLPLGAWSALFSILGLSVAVPLLRREGELLDRLQSAMLAGLVLGVGLASSPLALAAIAPLVVLLGVELYATADGEARRARAREALLLIVSITCVAALPAVGGPWQQPGPDGPVGRFARTAPLALLLAALPFAPAFWPPISRRLEARGSTRRVATLALLVAAVSIVVLVPGLPAPRMVAFPPAWALLFAIAFVCCLRDRRGAGLRAWCCVFPVAWVAASLDERGALFAGVAGTVLVAAAIWPVGRPSRRWLLAALAAVLVADLTGSWMSRHAAEARRATDARVAHALRELRTSTPSAGPWNSSRAVLAWCVAAPPALAPAVLVHARRPVLSAGGRVSGGADDPRGEALWTVEDADELRDVARSLGVRVVCLRPTDVDDLERRYDRELPFLHRLLGTETLGLDRELVEPYDEAGRAALAVVRLHVD